jgi:hypothetical protein
MVRLGLIHRPHPGLPRLAVQMNLGALTVPDACDWHQHIVLDGDALGNDVRSNCVPCGAVRRVQIARAVSAGDMRAPTAGLALDLYGRWGWDGTEAGDIGLASDVAAIRWTVGGIPWGGQWEDVPGITALDPANLGHLRAAISFLGPIQLDLGLPRSVQGAQLWAVTVGPEGEPASWGLHRVCVGRYDEQYLYAISWGIEIPMTLDFVARYAINAEATVSRSWLNTMGTSPAGLDLGRLERESAALSA